MDNEKNEKNAVEKRPLKVFVVGRSLGYANWVTDSSNLVNSIDEADLVLLTGGEDVNPKYYGEKVHPSTFFTERDVYEFEVIKESISKNKPLYGTCRGLQILTVAAGGKLVQHQSNKYSPHLMGDILNEDLDYFKSDYLETMKLRNFNKSVFSNFVNKNFNLTPTDDIVETLLYILKHIPLITTSAHHQAAYPYNLPKKEYKILAWTKGLHSMHENGDKEELDMPEEVEIESIYYPKINAFGIQGHPEWMTDECIRSIDSYTAIVDKLKTHYLQLEEHFKNSKVDIASIRAEFYTQTRSFQFVNDITSVVADKSITKAMSYFKTYLYFYAGLTKTVNDPNITIGAQLIRESLIKCISSLLISSKIYTFYEAVNGISLSTLKPLIKKGLISENYDDISENLLDLLISRITKRIFQSISDSTSTSLQDLYSLASTSSPTIRAEPIILNVGDPFARQIERDMEIELREVVRRIRGGVDPIDPPLNENNAVDIAGPDWLPEIDDDEDDF